MADFVHAINLICKYEGFNEKAYADPSTGAEPYTIGYGTQFYPDGSPVKKGHLCSKEKALEYLFHDVSIIDVELAKLNIGLDDYMRQALISFVYSIGWEPFLYSSVIDCIEQDDFAGATKELGRWIFNDKHQVIGGLVDRRREEIQLFLRDVNTNPWYSTEILLRAFRNYSGALHQVKAIRKLEENINPYVLSCFANEFDVSSSEWFECSPEELDALFSA
jgi:lysozyme